jgi:thiamine pyrophosphate-dependent acetolactate synthase large subunit-like protein
MLDKYTCLKKLAARRTDEVIVTTMSVAMPWAQLSDGPLDFASVESGMGHAADFAYGLAMSQPERRVITLNGDGSTLMCLGTLVTMAQRPLENFTLVITDNGTYEVTGNQPVPGAGIADYAAIARGAGLRQVYTLDDETTFDAMLPLHFAGKGPLVIVWKIEQGNEPVPKPARPIHERAHRLRQALAGLD